MVEYGGFGPRIEDDRRQTADRMLHNAANSENTVEKSGRGAALRVQLLSPRDLLVLDWTLDRPPRFGKRLSPAIDIVQTHRSRSSQAAPRGRRLG